MSKHTPAPWKIIDGMSSLRVIGADGYAVAAVRAKYRTQEHWATQRANAALIAAAPDLLEVARLVLDTATIETSVGLVEAARAAIAKATGAA